MNASGTEQALQARGERWWEEGAVGTLKQQSWAPARGPNLLAKQGRGVGVATAANTLRSQGLVLEKVQATRRKARFTLADVTCGRKEKHRTSLPFPKLTWNYHQ